MANNILESLFSSTPATKAPWRSYVTSILVHGAVIALLLVVTFPAIQEVEQIRNTHTTLIAPVLPKIPLYRPKPLRAMRIQPPVVPPHLIVPKVLPAPVIKVPEVKPQVLAAAPVIKEAVPDIHPITPAVMPKAAPAPKPEIKTGVFAQNDLAKGQRTPNEVKIGGFGDPHGVPSQNSDPSRMTMAKVGSFDLTGGPGNSGASGRGQNGGVRQTSVGSFGGGYSSARPSSGMQGGVKTGGFGDAATVSQAAVGPVTVAKPIATQVEILFKPKPLYTDEARRLKLEGQVSLDVVFLASGAVRVVRVIHGLGHGLDEAAQAAASQVRFRPATKAGVPVDTPATINIVFELT